jgi:uncharacterized ferritin-like protein (DUF455 family)
MSILIYLFIYYYYYYNVVDDILARIVVINLTHEAKGLDTYPKSRQKLLLVDDITSIETLDHNYEEEIGHVAIGVKWFHYICQYHELDPCIMFQSLSKQYFKGTLKGPFNTDARNRAGLYEDWYLPLTTTTTTTLDNSPPR